jgi:eukaryotic-like serine/threonine-protein kinase
MSLAANQRLGPYEIQSLLGKGGMGEVHKARDTRLDRTVAIKILKLKSEESRERFKREARTISSLNHPFICGIYDVGEQDGVDYLVLEYVEGTTLATRLKGTPLSLGETLRISAQVAEALEAAHRADIVHRDLKPGNIMLTKSGVRRYSCCCRRRRRTSISLPVAPWFWTHSPHGRICWNGPYPAPGDRMTLRQ